MIIEIYTHVGDSQPYIVTGFDEARDVFSSVLGALKQEGFRKTEFRVWLDTEGYHADAAPDFTGCPCLHRWASSAPAQLWIPSRVYRYVAYYQKNPDKARYCGITLDSLEALRVGFWNAEHSF